MSTRPTLARRLGVAEGAIRASGRRLLAGIRSTMRRRRDAEHLMNLNDRMLKDIGIDRSEIISVVYGGGRIRRYHNARD